MTSGEITIPARSAGIVISPFSRRRYRSRQQGHPPIARAVFDHAKAGEAKRLGKIGLALLPDARQDKRATRGDCAG